MEGELLPTEELNKLHEEALELDKKINEESNKNNEISPELEKERNGLLERIEKHRTKLENIAKTFGIDTDEFSDEDDSKFAENIKKEVTKLNACYKKLGLNPLLEVPKVEFVLNNKLLNFDLCVNYYVSMQAEAVRKIGRMTCLSHTNIIDNIKEAKDFLFTLQEREALQYFFGPGKSGGDFTNYMSDLKFKIEANFMMIDIKSRAENNHIVKKFVDWMKKLEIEPEGVYDFGNIFQYYSSLFGEEETNKLKEDVKDIIYKEEPFIALPSYSQSYHGPKDLFDIEIFITRILTRIAEIYDKRIIYLIDRAKTGDKLFKEVTEKSTDETKVYEVGQDFCFTEDDIQRVQELDLSWSETW